MSCISARGPGGCARVGRGRLCAPARGHKAPPIRAARHCRSRDGTPPASRRDSTRESRQQAVSSPSAAVTTQLCTRAPSSAVTCRPLRPPGPSPECPPSPPREDHPTPRRLTPDRGHSRPNTGSGTGSHRMPNSQDNGTPRLLTHRQWIQDPVGKPLGVRFSPLAPPGKASGRSARGACPGRSSPQCPGRSFRRPSICSVPRCRQPRLDEEFQIARPVRVELSELVAQVHHPQATNHRAPGINEALLRRPAGRARVVGLTFDIRSHFRTFPVKPVIQPTETGTTARHLPGPFSKPSGKHFSRDGSFPAHSKFRQGHTSIEAFGNKVSY